MLHYPMRPNNTSKLEIKNRSSSRSLLHKSGWQNLEIKEKLHLQDLFTTAVAKKGWWLNSNWTLSDGSRVPSREIRPRATLLCSATCSIRRSSDILSGSLEKLLLRSFALLCASLKQLYIDKFCIIIEIKSHAEWKRCLAIPLQPLSKVESKKKEQVIYHKKMIKLGNAWLMMPRGTYW